MEELWENLYLWFGLESLGVWNRCDSCGENITVEHDLQCRKIRIILVRHNNVED